jgi:hypothetical protein
MSGNKLRQSKNENKKLKGKMEKNKIFFPIRATGNLPEIYI